MADAQRQRTLRKIAKDLPDLQLNEAQTDFMSCMLGSLLAALPTFINAMMECLASTPPANPGYDPGDRPRCK